MSVSKDPKDSCRAPSPPALRSPGPPPPQPLPTGQQLRGRKVWAVGQLQRRSGWWVWVWVCDEGVEEPGAGEQPRQGRPFYGQRGRGEGRRRPHPHWCYYLAPSG